MQYEENAGTSVWTVRLALFILILGAIYRLSFYLAGDSFWSDEAALSLNIVGRTFAGLLKPLDYNQELKETLGLGFSVLADDGTVAERYGANIDGKLKPTLAIVDRHGTLGWLYVGECEPALDWPTPEYIFRHMVIARGV